MADSTPVTLQDFAAANPPKGRCLLCSVAPEVERQAREGKAAGITYRVIARWLETIVNEPVTKGRLERHFQQEHERR